MFNRTEHEEKEKQNRTFLFVAATQHRDADFRWPRRRRFRWRLRDATTTLRSNIIYTRRVEGTDQTHSRGCVLKRKASKRRETMYIPRRVLNFLKSPRSSHLGIGTYANPCYPHNGQIIDAVSIYTRGENCLLKKMDIGNRLGKKYNFLLYFKTPEYSCEWRAHKYRIP